MPPLPRIGSAVLADLSRQVRFAPPEALRKHIARAESLAAEIEPKAQYPGDWIVYRITGYRPDAQGGTAILASVAGTELLRDLSALVEGLCEHAGVRLAELLGAISAKELGARWGVSVKTIDRYRRAGLVARRAADRDGRPHLAFMPGVVHAFERSHAKELSAATAYSRIDPGLRARLISRAQGYRRRLGLSRHAAAERLGARFGRSAEAVRTLLEREDERRQASGEPAIFADRRPMSPAETGGLYSRWRVGEEASALARQLGVGRTAVQRAINLERAGRLFALLEDDSLSTPSIGEITIGAALGDWTAHPLLAPARARSGLAVPGITDLGAFIEASRPRRAVGPREERALLLAYHVLRVIAREWIGRISRANPQSDRLDQAETALRWSARIKAEIVRMEIPLAIQTLESVLGATLDTLAPDQCRDVIARLVHAIAGASDRADPTRGGRLAAPAGMALHAVATAWAKEHRAPREAAKKQATRMMVARETLPDWTLAVSSWQAFLEPDPVVRGLLDSIPSDGARILRLRMGWDGGPPRSMNAVAGELGISRLLVPRLEQRAIRAALASLREPAP
ncbi:MAG: hypothetical protein AABZ53_14810 [Planctomycetota bacterium]